MLFEYLPILIFLLFALIFALLMLAVGFTFGPNKPDREKNSPYECGFDKYVNIDSDVDFLGKEKLKKIKAEGIKKKLMGVKIDAKEISVNGSMDLVDEDNNVIGELRSGCYNPTFKQVIGIAMINKPHFETSKSFKININGSDFDGKVCDLPFI